jgi:hypothetical protein
VLEIWVTARTDDAAANAGADLFFNNDSGSNYDLQTVRGINTTASASVNTAFTSVRIEAHGTGGTANYAAVSQLSVPDFTGTTFFKTGMFLGSLLDGTAANNDSLARAFGWRSTSAITRVKVAAISTAKLKVGSQLLIYKRLAS